MKILLIGSDKVFAIENFYVKYLRKSGHTVIHYPAQSLFYDYLQRSIFNKILFRLGYRKIYQTINKELREQIAQINPDILFVFKGMEIFPETLVWTKNREIKLVNYNPDNPFIFSGRGSGNKNITASISLYNIHLTYNQEVKKRIETEFNIPTGILPFGFEISNELYNECCQEQEIIKACFIGNPDGFRAKFILQIAEGGINLDVYGHSWSKYIQHPNINIFEPVYGIEFWKTLRKYRVQLNLMRPHNPESHNMRSFEIPGVGGIQLAPDTPDHKTYFEPGKEFFLYANIDECASQIKKLLALKANEAMEIRGFARMRSINSGYSYKDRTIQALEKIKTLI